MTEPAAPLRIDLPDQKIHLVIHGPEAAAEITDVINESLEHLRPFMAWASRPTTVVEQAMRMATVVEQARYGGDAIWSVVDDEGDRVVGGIGLHHRGPPDALDVGYWLHPQATGRGLISAAAAAVTRIAFEVYEKQLVRITCDEANVASAAVPRRLGFRHVTTIDEPRAAPADTNRTMVWELTRSEWEGSVAAQITVVYC